jgi:NAD(P)-dependent dehydrogenase (short-subunit alcohol dehydrogenase family)
MKRYLVTGARGGLGWAVQHALRMRDCTRDGVEVVTMARGDHPFPQPVIHWDFGADPAETTKVIKTLGPLDGIVHCAGVEIVAPLRLTGDADYRRAMMAADSAFAILRAAASKGVMADGGSIVLMSSVAAHRGTAGMVAYSAGKAAVEGMVRAAAAELAPRKIRVNAIAAGAFRSPMHLRILDRMPAADGIDAYAAAHPLGFGNVDDVRDAALYLLSDAARWITGTTMVVDGGYLAA